MSYLRASRFLPIPQIPEVAVQFNLHPSTAPQPHSLCPVAFPRVPLTSKHPPRGFVRTLIQAQLPCAASLGCWCSSLPRQTTFGSTIPSPAALPLPPHSASPVLLISEIPSNQRIKISCPCRASTSNLHKCPQEFCIFLASDRKPQLSLPPLWGRKATTSLPRMLSPQDCSSDPLIPQSSQ